MPAALIRPACYGLRLGALAAATALLLQAFGAAAPAQSGHPPVFLTEVSGAIGVATVRQLLRAIAQAEAAHGEALIVRLDTPGGLVSSTRDLIKQTIASTVPIVVYVAPSGARAASAGTFLVYAANIAAMAPGTNLGAATPIQIGGGLPGLPQPQNDQGKDDKKAEQAKSAGERKAINDVIAMIRSLAQLRGRNIEFAEKAVSEAATMTATEAQKAGVVDLVAGNLDDLLNQIDGRKATVGGTERTLSTKGAKVEIIEPDLRTRLLSVISDPNIAFILLMIGFYGLILEFWSPGFYAPGVIGAISLILALIALTALPVNYGALGLLVLGIGLMIGELFVPGTAALGIGGVIAFLAGSYFLFENVGGDVRFGVSLPLIGGIAVTTAALIFGVVAAAIKARERPAVSGSEQLIGATARILDWQDNGGHIRINGEVWSARGTQPLRAGATVRVVGREGLTLVVES
jgi:membrane-bound serine protease (ClpP class)